MENRRGVGKDGVEGGSRKGWSRGGEQERME